MKYLENLSLENLTKGLTNRELGGGLIVNGKIETYATKKAGEDKKSSKILGSKFSDTQGKISAIGDLGSKSTQRLLVDLIQTLNASNVDYDFSSLSADSFSLVTSSEAIQSINSHLAELTLQTPSFLNTLWKEISISMGNLTQCEVYKLNDNCIGDDDVGSVWSFSYFFTNKDLRRICLVSCSATSKFRKLAANDVDDADDMNVEEIDRADPGSDGNDDDNSDNEYGDGNNEW